MSRSPWNTSLAGLTLACCLLGAGCEPPPVVPTADRRQSVSTSRIEGTIVVQGSARGHAVVLLYDADRPPPPLGTGRPVSFTLIPQQQLFGQALDSPALTGPFTAPFAFSLVPPGRYTVRGFIDADTCRGGAQPCHSPDFIPWYDVTAQPNAGDVGGAALVDTTTRQPRVLEIAPREDGSLPALTEVTVTFSEAATVPVDRPAFQVEGSSRLEPAAGPTLLTLRPQSVQQGVLDVRPPGFLVRYVDDDNNGEPDDADGDGKPDLWPRVVVRKVSDSSPLLDENDLDRNGVLDAEGVDYPRADGSQDALPDAVVLAAGLVSDPLLAALEANQGQPLLVPELTVGVRPLAFDARDPRAPALLRAVPSGRYALYLVQFTGQTWRVPNELSPAAAPTLGLPAVDTQAFTLEVP